MRSTRFAASIVLGVCLALALAAPAVAATKSAAASTPVDAAAGGPIDLQIWPGQGVDRDQTAIITVVEVDAATKLPVTVRIPVMPGSVVEWAGEILGGPASSDIEQPFKLVQGQGGQFAEFTLTKSHRGQVDAIGFPLQVQADMVSLSVDYVQSVSSTLTAMSVRLPANISKVKISPKPSGDPVDNADGESLYILNPKPMKPGEKQTVAISFSTIPPVEPAPGSDLNPLLIGLGVALLVAVVAVVVLVRRQAAAAAHESGADDDEAYDEDDDPDDEADSPADDQPLGDDDDEPDLDFQ